MLIIVLCRLRSDPSLSLGQVASINLTKVQVSSSSVLNLLLCDPHWAIENEVTLGYPYIIIIIIMTRRQLRSVATTLHDDRDPVPSSTPV